MPEYFQKPQEKIVGCILAGGTSKRFGGLDKAWLKIQSQPMLAWTYQCIHNQVAQTAINHNQNFEQYKNFAEQYNIPLVTDKRFINQGPLSGIYSALSWGQTIEANWLISIPVDMPKLPSDCVQRLYQHALDNFSDVVVATDTKTNHHTLALWSTKSQPIVAQQLSRNQNKIRDSFALLNHSTCLISSEPLANINQETDLQNFKNKQ